MVTRVRLERPDQELGPVQEFAIAGIARVALQHGNDHRSRPAKSPSIESLGRAYISLPDPEFEAGEIDVSTMLVRFAHEQFPAQSGGLEQLGRLHALAAGHLPYVRNGPTLADWEAALGVSLVDYWRVGWILHTAFASNEGVVAWETLAAEHVVTLFDPLGWEEVRSVIESHFVQTVEAARQAARDQAQPRSFKWSYNPLEGRPILDTGGDLICPAPHFLFAQLTPTGLYYLGLRNFGHDFGQALGDAFESYVGAQLALLRYAQVHGEISYDRGRKSCDYILVTSECVLLVECKSGRPDVDSRLGYGTKALDKVAKAKSQLETTAQLIRARHSNFGDIPNDRPLLGLIVTLEPHYVIESWSEETLTSAVLPIADATALDLEILTATLADRMDTGERLRDRLWPRPPLVGPPRLLAALDDIGQPYPRNPIVEAAWDVLSDLPALAQARGDETTAANDATAT